MDTVTHGWDVACALGTDVTFDVDVVEAALHVAEQVPGGDYRTTPGGSFAPVVPVGAHADAWTRTLALLGRDHGTPESGTDGSSVS